MGTLPEFLVVISFATFIHSISCHENINMKRKYDLIQESSAERKHQIYDDTRVEQYKTLKKRQRQPDKVCTNGPYKQGGNDYQECVTKKCPKGSWCHLGASNETIICCNNGPHEENPCLLDMNEGSGSYNLTRFFYNKTSDKCISFTYSGDEGNSNMFKNEKDCRNTCVVCADGAVEDTCNFNMKPRDKCDSTDSWCSLGDDVKNTMLCCKKNSKVNRCMLPMEEGVGSDKLTRYFYNSKTDKCINFKFNGRLGNENMFMSPLECEEACSICKYGPFLPSSKIVQCSKGSSCPHDSFCNFGLTNDTTICCIKESQSGNPCHREKNTGVGNKSAKKQLYFYHHEIDQCEEFDYKGRFGNENMFKTEPECSSACEVCKEGAMENAGNAINCFKKHMSCPPDSWCNIGANKKETICCKQAQASDNRCYEPKEVGKGDANKTVHFYDSTKDECFEFKYNGRLGSGNLFDTKPNCRSTCKVCKEGARLDVDKVKNCYHDINSCLGDSWCNLGLDTRKSICCNPVSPRKERCFHTLEKGTGNDDVDLIYYNRNFDKCMRFKYNGRQGNENMFKKENKCKETCAVCQYKAYVDSTNNKTVVCDIESSSKAKKCPKDAWCNSGYDDATKICCEKESTSDDPCQYSYDNKGYDHHNIPRYHYNAKQDKCLKFDYLGRFGNQNMFTNEQDCNAACRVCDNGAAMNNSARVQCSLNHTHDPARGCPTGSWCNLGLNETFQICCDRDKTDPDPCSMPVRKGRGTDYKEERFYYDPDSNQCQRFQYKGRSGNQNMFLMQENCSDLCGAEHSCSAGALKNFETGADQECNMDSSTGLEQQCPEGSWCHLGTTNITKICCKEAVIDPCSLQLEEGKGIAFLERYFYNSSLSTCQRFEYKGRGGNQNMFMDLADCRVACEDAHPLCTNGSLKDNVSGKDTLCSIASDKNLLCPEGFWCHLGETLNSTVCCKETTNDTCSLTVDVGRGNATLNRFYYNPTTNKCTKFFYRGRFGNQNMFDNPTQCFATCGERHEVCQLGALRDNTTSDDRRCNITSDLAKSCPADSWCHAGQSNNATICCYRDIGDICSYPMNEGSGNASLERYYYDPSLDHCEKFTYKGYLGNQNMFLDPNDCYDICGVCIDGLLVDSPLEMSVQCNLDYRSGKEKKCSTDSWCHLGNSSETKVCCLGATSDPCSLPRNDGEGTASLIRYFHNSATGECEEMKYKGRRGNQNMFVDELECRIACKKAHPLCLNGSLKNDISGQDQKCSVDPGAEIPCPEDFWCHLGETEEFIVCCKKENEKNPCALPLDLGRGSGSVQRFYYDNAAGLCKEFQYRGKLGNRNMFASASDCALACGNGCLHGTLKLENTSDDHPCNSDPNAQDACPAGTWCHIGETSLTTVCCQNAERDPCTLKMDKGRGAASLERYFYNSDDNKCEAFKYNGLLGNQNMFLDASKCNNACYKPTTITTTTSMPEVKATGSVASAADSESGNILGLKKEIFIALIIVVIIIIIIVLLLCWFFLCRKNNKKSAKAKAGKTKKSHTKHGKSKKPISNKQTVQQKHVESKPKKPAKQEETGQAKPRPDKPKRHRDVEKKKTEKKGEKKPTDKKDSKSQTPFQFSDRKVKEKHPKKEITGSEQQLEQNPKVEDAKVAAKLAVDKEIKKTIKPESKISEQLHDTQKDSLESTPAIVKGNAPAEMSKKLESKSTPRPSSPEVSASSGSPDSASDEHPASVTKSDVSVVRTIEAPSKPKITLVPMPKRRF